MSAPVQTALATVQDILQRLAMTLVVLTAVGLTGLAVAAGLGLVPWLEMTATFGEMSYPQAGMAVQLAVTFLAVLLCFYLPGNARIIALENSHRSFHIGMRDVTRAYAAAHRADREGVFELQSEFDSIRERMEFLRSHPDLLDLEPGVIEVAAQMSHLSRELADTYSDNNVQRARDFLIQRQQEIEDFNERVEDAKAVTTEIRRWLTRVEMEEDVARSQLSWLREELTEILPELLPDAGESTADETAPEAHPGPVPAAVWPDEADDYDGDDRIVALLARRAAK